LFEEAIMLAHIRLLSAVAVGAAAFFAIPAIAADEGTVTAKFTSTGTPLEVIPVGQGVDHVFVEEEQGTIERGGGSHPWRCLWMTFINQHDRFDSRGYCLETDQDLDQIVLKTTSEGDGSTGSGAGEVVLGDGKYAGTTGKIAFTCQFVGNIGKYTANCDAQVSYKTPPR
jgi:hypothetical protein